MQSDPSVVLRAMRAGEEKELLQMARRAFSHSPFEQLGIAKPGQALVAEVDGAIAGAMFLRTFSAGKQKTGYLDVGFVKKEYRGRGVARALYPAATQQLYQMGCTRVAALVIDDNAPSWKPLQNQGFGAPSLTELVRALGFAAAFSLWLRTFFCVATGARLWLSGPVNKRHSIPDLIAFFLVNILLFLPGLLFLLNRPDALVHALAAYPCVLLAGVLFGGAGCLAAGGSWRFSFVRGGLLLTLLLNTFTGVFPMVGRWYPKAPRATKKCRRALGVQASVEWAGMLLLFFLGAFVLEENWFFYNCASLAATLLVYRILPFMPFGSFGSARVWGWNKIAFVVLAGASLAALLLLLYI